MLTIKFLFLLINYIKINQEITKTSILAGKNTSIRQTSSRLFIIILHYTVYKIYSIISILNSFISTFIIDYEFLVINVLSWILIEDFYIPFNLVNTNID